ncbi:putative porin [Oxalobacteraceae bacterium GrIS 1.11]
MKHAFAYAALGALMAGAAHAQSGITVYGNLDVAAEMVKAGPVGQTGRVSSNSSGLGFKGGEDLGAGLKAFFQIEGGVGLDDGSGNLNARDSFLGLMGRFGAIKMGFFSSPMRAMGGKVNFVPGASSIANNIGVFTTLNGLPTNLNARMPNALQYATPDLAGFSAAVIYSPGENKGAGRNDVSWGHGLTYVGGPLYLAYAHEVRRAQQKLALGDSRDSGHRLGSRYVVGDTSVGLAWDRLGSDGLYGGADGAIARDAWTASAMHTMGAHDVMLHYTRAYRIKCAGAANSGQCAPANVAGTGAHQISLLYHYTFSKRTLIQAYYSVIRNGANAVYDYDVNPVVAAPAARKPGVAPTGLGLGIRHSF